MTKHTPGPWYIAYGGREDQDFFVIGSRSREAIVSECSNSRLPNEELSANARLIAAAPDRHDQLTALMLGWEVDKIAMYDEEGVEGWIWTEPDGTEHVEMGDWNELPTWPESARQSLAKAIGEAK